MGRNVSSLRLLPKETDLALRGMKVIKIKCFISKAADLRVLSKTGTKKGENWAIKTDISKETSHCDNSMRGKQYFLLSFLPIFYACLINVTIELQGVTLKI